MADDEPFVRHLARLGFSAYSRNPARSIELILGEQETETIVAEIDGSPVGFVVVGHRVEASTAAGPALGTDLNSRRKLPRKALLQAWLERGYLEVVASKRTVRGAWDL
jgi:hypothetical protein